MPPRDDFPEQLDIAMAEATDLTAQTVREHALEQLAGWSLDEATGRLLFADSRQRYAMMSAQVVGLYDPKTAMWRWAWSEDSFAAHLLQAAHHARSWGTANDVSLLTQASATIDEATAWKLTAFTARLVGWPGIYRGIGGPSEIYLAFAPATQPAGGKIDVARTGLLPPSESKS